MNELDLFAAAIAIADPGERSALMDRECAGRPDVRQRIDQLLDAHFRSHPLLDQPIPEVTGAYVPSEQPGAVIAGRYKLLEKIGEGGMGEVWVADQIQPVRRRVALKVEPGLYLDVRHEISHLPDPRAGWVQVRSVPQWSGPVKAV